MLIVPVHDHQFMGANYFSFKTDKHLMVRHVTIYQSFSIQLFLDKIPNLICQFVLCSCETSLSRACQRYQTTMLIDKIKAILIEKCVSFVGI